MPLSDQSRLKLMAFGPDTCHSGMALFNSLGNIPQEEMDRVFNMGIGFVMIVSPYFADSICNQLNEDRVTCRVIGDVREGEPGVEWM